MKGTLERKQKNECVEKAKVECSPPIFTYWDQFFLLLSIAGYIFNKIIDVVLIHTYLTDGHVVRCLLTVLIVTVPQALVNLVSYRWHVHDSEASTSLLVMHCCQLGVFLRLVAQFSDGRKWRRSRADGDAMLYLQQSSDVSLLLLFLGYLESAPQLLLQVYVTSTEDGWQLVQGVSAALALLALAWSNASYAKWMRLSRGDKLPLGGAAAFLQLLWRLCLLLARVSALLCCALLLGGWLLLLLLVHWLIMTGWVLSQGTDLFPTRWEERLFNAIVGGIYCFCFFNVKDTPARWRMLSFYTLVFAENAALTALFALYWPHPWGALYTVLLANVALGSALGTLLLVVYYVWVHPNAAARPATVAPAGPPGPMNPTAAAAGGVVVGGPGGAQTTGTLRSLKGHAAGRVSAVSLRSAGGVSLTSQPEQVTSHQPDPTTSQSRRNSPPSAAASSATATASSSSAAATAKQGTATAVTVVRDRPFRLASELLLPLSTAAAATTANASKAGQVTGASGHVTARSASSLPSREGHVTGAERRHRSATAILQRSADSSGTSETAAGRVSDIPQLDAVSEGDITLPTSPDIPVSPVRESSGNGGVSSGGGAVVNRGGEGGRDIGHASGRGRGTGGMSSVVGGKGGSGGGGEAGRTQSGNAGSGGMIDKGIGGGGGVEGLVGRGGVVDKGGDSGDGGGSSSGGAGDSTAVNHSRVTSTASGLPPDYENVISVSVHRAGPGVRAWRTYSDVGDSAHDYSIVTERAGRLDETETESASAIDDASAFGGRHTYQNTDNVALMIAHLEDADTQDEAGPETGGGDASLLVATIDAVERSGVSALFSSPPRRSRSTDDLASARVPAGRESGRRGVPTRSRRLLNTSFDPGLLVAPPNDGSSDYKSPRSPPEAIYARPMMTGRRAAAAAAAAANATAPSNIRSNSDQRATGMPSAPVSSTTTAAAAVPGGRQPLSNATANRPAAASPRRKFSVLRSRFEPAGRRYAVTPSAAVARRPSLKEAARALWGGRVGKENAPPPPLPDAASPTDV